MLPVCRSTLDVAIFVFLGVPYSEQACRDAAAALGLKLGNENAQFSYDYRQKGCFAYKAGLFNGVAFYGKGGSVEDMKKTPTQSTAYRPENHDCAAGKCSMCVCMYV